MTNSRSGEFSPAQLARLGAFRAAAFEVRMQISALQAREMRLLDSARQVAAAVEAESPASSRESEMPYRVVAAEFGAAFRISDRSVQRMMGEAEAIIIGFPATFEAFAAGRISRAHVGVIVDAGAHITDAAARASFEETAVPVAERESASRLRPYAKQAAERLHPRSLTERHKAAAAGRSVRVVDLPDGMAELTATLPGVLAHAAHDRLSAMAREVARTNAAAAAAIRDALGRKLTAETDESCHDRRTADQLRADILADLLLAGRPEGHIGTGLSAIRASVQVVIPMLALLGCSDEPATLAGVGPMDAQTARRFAGDAKGWDRVLTHPVTGAVLATDRYRPGNDLKRALQVRDQHCRFPGCRMAVWKCDLDHTIDYALGGETSECNLAHLCRRHHMLKHESAWTVEQQPGGVLVWTSPTGQVYEDIPTSRVLFKPLPEPVHDLAPDPAPF